jgi:hypothetical protein
MAGCGGSGGSGFPGVDGGGSGSGGSGSGGSGSGGSGNGSGGCGLVGCSGDGGGSGGSSGGGPAPCPSGLMCNVSCPNGGTTSISGIVYDPAGANPLYNIAVYVPATALQPLPAGVPTGAAECNCSALFPSGAVVSTATGVDGSFKLTNVPVGNVPLVLQVGKWRREVQVTTTACGNATPTQKLTLPGTLAGAGPNDNMPDIAVSTGDADTLECLMQRIGIPPSEYTNGAGGSGHVHLFAGGDTGGGQGGGRVGEAERPGWGSPASDTSLWNAQASLMPYDILLLSCEGGETYDADPQVLEEYLNAGGRAFASHYHYAWFSGPIDSVGVNTYTAPGDWGTNLATWSDSQAGNQTMTNGKIVQTLNGGTAPFAKGQALYQWLGLVNALGVNGAPTGDINIQAPRYNAVVGPSDKPSQPWIDDVSSNYTLYFSFDTPVGGEMPLPTDGGAPSYCGRAVFSDLHVSGSAATLDPSGAGGGAAFSPTSTSACSMRPMLPQEKALEFMLFDLSSCVIPDTETPPDAGVPPPTQ